MDNYLMAYIRQNHSHKLLNDFELESLYGETLYDAQGMVEVCGYRFLPAIALKRIDEVAFRCDLSNWAGKEFDMIGDDYIAKNDLIEIIEEYKMR